MNKNIKYLAFFVLALLGGLYMYNKYKVAPEVDFSKLKLYDLTGNEFKLSDLKGKKVVVSFGASWCPNCIDELNMLTKVKDQSLSDVEIVVISDESIEKVQSFKQRKNYPFTFIKMDQSFGSIGVNSIPTTYIINTRQEVKDVTIGYIDWEDPSTVEHLKKIME